MLTEVTQDLVEWISQLSPLGLYGAFVLVSYIENIVPPIPGDILVAFGGYLAAEHVVMITPVFLLTTVASVAGFMTMYMIGSYWGTRIDEKNRNKGVTRFVPIKYMERVRRWMRRWGQGVIVANRFLAGTRSVISLTAGISRTPVSSTILSSAVSSVLWNSILLGFGWIVHENWQVIGEYLAVYSRIILSGILLFVVIRVALHYYRKYKRASGQVRK